MLPTLAFFSSLASFSYIYIQILFLPSLPFLSHIRVSWEIENDREGHEMVDRELFLSVLLSLSLILFSIVSIIIIHNFPPLLPLSPFPLEFSSSFHSYIFHFSILLPHFHREFQNFLLSFFRHLLPSFVIIFSTYDFLLLIHFSFQERVYVYASLASLFLFI